MPTRVDVGRALRNLLSLMLVASACTDGGGRRIAFTDAGDPSDASARDSSADADSGLADAHSEDGGAEPTDADPPIPPLMCGGRACMPHQPSLLEPIVPAGCARDHLDAEVCGLATPDASLALDASTPAFLPKDARGIASPSCGLFLEAQLEQSSDAGFDAGDGGYPNAQIDLQRSILLEGVPLEIVHVFPGCCGALGVCALDTRRGLAYQTRGHVSYNAGYGCIDPKLYLGPVAAELPVMHCDPQTGLIIPPDASVDGGRDAGPTDAGEDGGNG